MFCSLQLPRLWSLLTFSVQPTDNVSLLSGILCPANECVNDAQRDPDEAAVGWRHKMMVPARTRFDKRHFSCIRAGPTPFKIKTRACAETAVSPRLRLDVAQNINDSQGLCMIDFIYLRISVSRPCAARPLPTPAWWRPAARPGTSLAAWTGPGWARGGCVV